MAEDIHYAWNLAQARYLAIGNVGHMHTTVEWQHVMLTQGIEINILDDDHLITSLLMKDGSSEYRHWVLIVATR